MRGMTTLYPGGISTWEEVTNYVTPVDKILLDSIGFEFYTIEYTLGVNVNKGYNNLALRIDNIETDIADNATDIAENGSDIADNVTDIASNGSRITAIEGDYVPKSGGEFEGNIGFNYYNIEYNYLYSCGRLNFTDESVTVIGTKNEDDMASDSAEHLSTQQSIKAYQDDNCKDSVFFGDEVRTSTLAATGGWGTYIDASFTNAPTSGNGVVFVNLQAYGTLGNYYEFRIVQWNGAAWIERGECYLYDYSGYGNRPYMFQAPVNMANGTRFAFQVRERSGGTCIINIVANPHTKCFLTLIAGNVYISAQQTT